MNKYTLYAKISKLKYYRTWNWDNPINKKAKKKTPAKKYKKNTLKKDKSQPGLIFGYITWVMRSRWPH